MDFFVCLIFSHLFSVKFVDDLACRGLDLVEAKVPILQQPANKVWGMEEVIVNLSVVKCNLVETCICLFNWRNK